MMSHAKWLLWIASLGLSTALLASCERSEPSAITLEMGKVERINGCHVSLDLIRYYKDGSPLADFRFVCDVPESALKEKNWWGNQTPPLMFSMLVGDCMRLKKMWYCAEKIEPAESVMLKATFQTVDSDITVINRVK